MIRPSAPRFLNFGDQFDLPVVVQNQTNEAYGSGHRPQRHQFATDGHECGKRVAVPANDRVEVRFPATTMSAGTARFQVAAVAGDLCRRGHRRTARLHPRYHRSLRHLWRAGRCRNSGRSRPTFPHARWRYSWLRRLWKSALPPRLCKPSLMRFFT